MSDLSLLQGIATTRHVTCSSKVVRIGAHAPAVAVLAKLEAGEYKALGVAKVKADLYRDVISIKGWLRLKGQQTANGVDVPITYVWHQRRVLFVLWCSC